MLKRVVIDCLKRGTGLNSDSILKYVNAFLSDCGSLFLDADDVLAPGDQGHAGSISR